MRVTKDAKEDFRTFCIDKKGLQAHQWSAIKNNVQLRTEF